MPKRAKIGAQLGAYLALRPLLQPLMYAILRRRVARGKDDPTRWQEKLGLTNATRPEGPVIWLHAVGLGEVLALRPLLSELQRQSPNVSFVITSTARSSGKVVADNLPANATHQFLPLDGPRYLRRFLDHWRPALSIWSEQDFWPGAIYDTAHRGIPLAYINARIDAESFAKRQKMSGIYRNLLPVFGLVTAQDRASAQYLSELGASDPQVLPSLKPAAEPLSVNETDLTEFKTRIGGRDVWVAASTHVADEAVLLGAHNRLKEMPEAPLLVLAPRVPDRRDDILAAIKMHGLTSAQRSAGELPSPDTDVYLADTFGELGLWYRVAKVAFVGASFGGLGGHNPWEPACLGLSVLHGPATQNFMADYKALTDAGIASLFEETSGADAQIANAVALAVQEAKSGSETATDAARLVSSARAALVPLAKQLLTLGGVKHED